MGKALNDDVALRFWENRLEEFSAWAEPRLREADESIEWCEAVLRKFGLTKVQGGKDAKVGKDGEAKKELKTELSDDNDEIQTDYFLTLEHFTCAIVGIGSCDETIHEKFSKIKTVQEFVSFAKDYPECLDESLLPEGIRVDNVIDVANEFGIFRSPSARFEQKLTKELYNSILF